MISKVWMPVLTLSFLVFGLVAKVLEAIESKTPLGYQDKTGFHFGAER